MATINVTIPLDSGFTHILLNIAAQGFEYIKFNYSGAGDSGMIDAIILIPHGCIEIKDEKVNQIKPFPPQENDLGIKLAAVLEEVVYSKILENAHDWYNNEGGGGTLYLCTLDGNYHGDHYVYITETQESTLSGKLGDY